MIRLDEIQSTNPWDPWLGMYVAVTRQYEGGGVLDPDRAPDAGRSTSLLHDGER